MDVKPSGGGIIKIEETVPSAYPDTVVLASGIPTRLEAVPASGYQFDGWSEDLSGTTNPITITMDCDRKVTANFSPLMHTLTVQVSGSGSITPTADSYSYTDGAAVSITATPDDGWQFDGWTGDVANPGSATTVVTMDSDKTFTANFSPVKPNWWLPGGIIAGVIIIGVLTWAAVKRRMA